MEQHEQLMSEFENNYTEFKNHSFEMQHTFFRAVEEREEGFFNSLAQLAQVSVDYPQRSRLARSIYSSTCRGALK